jgi:hypothetical protein
MSCRTAVAAGGRGFDPENWWGAVDDEIFGCLAGRREVSLTDLCAETGVSEGEMSSFLATLAHEGRVRISRVEPIA